MRALTACRCAPRRARWSPSSARAAAASRRCSSSCAGCRRPTPARVAAPPAALMPQRDGLLPWLSALDNAGAGAARRRRSASGRRARPRTSTSPPSGSRASSARGRGAVRRHAPARRVPAHAARRPARAVPRRAVRRARRAHPRADAALAGATRWRASRARCCSSRTTSRRRCCSPTAIVLLSPRPGRVVADARRRASRARATRDDRAVVALRERALDGAREPRVMRRCSSCSSASAAGRRSCALGVVDELILPAPTAGRSRRCGPTARCSRPTSRSTTWEVVLGLRAGDRRRRRARRRHAPLARRRPRAAPAVIGSQAVPVPVIAPLRRPRARLRPGAEGAAGRARLLLPGDHQPLRRPARRRPRRAQAAALARRTRWQTLRMLEAPARCPPPSPA